MSSKLIENLTCHICKQLYTDPTVLPCMHTFCKQCVSSLVISDMSPETLLDVDSIDSDNECKQEKNHIKCPTCNSVSVLDDKGIEDLPENKTYASIVKRYKENIKQNKKPVTCDLCDESEVKPALKSCMQCRLSYCLECLDQCHPKRGKLSSHKLCEPIKEFQDYHDDSLEENVLLHDDWSDKFPVGYCIDCCLAFRTTEPERKRHEDHQYLDIKIAKAHIIANLEVRASRVEFFRNQYQKFTHGSEFEIENLQMEEKRRVSEVKKSIRFLYSHLEEKEHSLIGQIKSEIISKIGDQTRLIEEAGKMASEARHEAQEIRDVVENDFVDISMEQLIDLKSRLGKLRPFPEEMIGKKIELSRYVLDIRLVENAISALCLKSPEYATIRTPHTGQMISPQVLNQGFQYGVQQNPHNMPYYLPVQAGYLTGPVQNRLTGAHLYAQRPNVYPLGNAAAPQQVNQLQAAISAFVLENTNSKQVNETHLGERLFPHVHQLCPEKAGKVTGMLLELDQTEIERLLESKELLQEKVESAIDILIAHETKH